VGFTKLMYVNREGLRSVSFTLVKDISYVEEEKFKNNIFGPWNAVDEKMERLKRLQKEDFGKIKIPEFTFEKLNKTTIRIVSRFVKGRYVNLHEQLLIKKYVVDRVNKPDSEYSFQDYHPNNYIIEREKPYNIYVIDLEDYRRISLKERQDKWNTQWRQDKFKEYNKLYYRSK